MSTSVKYKEIRLNSSGKITVHKCKHPTNLGALMFNKNYIYTTSVSGETAVKKAKKMLIKYELKEVNKTLKKMDKKKKGILKNKI